MATETSTAPSVLQSSTGDPEKTLAELEKAMSNTKLQHTSFVPDPPSEKAEEINGTAAAPAEKLAPIGNGHASQGGPPIATTGDNTAAIKELHLPHSSADGRTKKPFDAPLDISKAKARPELSIDQELKYKSLLETVSKWAEIPQSLTKGAPTSAITDEERMFMTRECLLRYLRADKWNVDQAATRLKNTLAWRREYNIKKLTPDYVGIENETGKQLIIGWDNDGRPCQYMRPSKQNTERSDRQIEHLVFMLERSIDMMPAGQETLTLLINFAETKSGQGATLSQGKQTLYILQNHYPERLGRALVTNVPWYIWTFFKLITPFIDPLTKEKIKFNEDSGTHVPREQLLKESGGHVQFDYDHSEYWSALNKLCELKREAYRERWEKGGKRIGEHEGYLRGGDGKSLQETEEAA